MRARLLRHLGIAALLLAFMSATLLPRFGLVWHDHDDADHDHDHPASELARLLGMFHEEHTREHASTHDHDEPGATPQDQLLDADISRLHGHYVADGLLVFGSGGVLPSTTILRLFLPVFLYCVPRLRHAIMLLARAPPSVLIADFPQS